MRFLILLSLMVTNYTYANTCADLFQKIPSRFPISLDTLKTEGIPFEKFSPETLRATFDEAFLEYQTNIQKIAENKEPATFQNTIEALEHANYKVEVTLKVIAIYKLHNDSPLISELSGYANGIAEKFNLNIYQNVQLFERVKQVYQKKVGLSKEDTALLEKRYKSFKENGFGLPEQSKNRLAEIAQRVEKVKSIYSSNVLKSTQQTSLIVENAAELEGIPANVIAKFAANAREQNRDGYVISFDNPSYIAIMTYAKSRDFREKVAREHAKIAMEGEFNNQPYVLELVALRTEYARLLGYRNYAEFALTNRMAEKTDTVWRFYEKLLKVVRPIADREMVEIKKLALERDEVQELKPWDVNYYVRELKELKTNLDTQKLKQYFEVSHVKEGFFELLQIQYGIRFKEIKNASTWHEDVSLYEVREETGELIGHIYMDLYQRNGVKKSGAWMEDVLTQGDYQNINRRPWVVISLNLLKPANGPTLMEFTEVNTFFHEMGHALHGLFSKVKHRSLASPNTMWDFVELPSQMMENFLLDRRVLDMVGRHYQTGEKIPEPMYNSIINAQAIGIGIFYLRQISVGLLDFHWYTTEKLPTDLQAFEFMATQPTRLFPPMEGNLFSVNFGHIFGGGYEAGYYSYLWAKALDKDAYAYFQQNGTINRALGDKFRHELLAKGSSEHPAILFKNFRGRKADPEALTDYIRKITEN